MSRSSAEWTEVQRCWLSQPIIVSIPPIKKRRKGSRVLDERLAKEAVARGFIVYQCVSKPYLLLLMADRESSLQEFVHRNVLVSLTSHDLRYRRKRSSTTFRVQLVNGRDRGS
jgi:uncharacterized lipoprotein YajG